MGVSSRSKYARKKALKWLAESRGVSYQVALNIMAWWSTEKKTKFVDRFRPTDEEWNKISQEMKDDKANVNG